MSEDLKPCPCCESESHLSEYSDDFRRGTVYSVWCSKCGLHTKDYSKKEEAIKAWNNRPSPWHTGTPTEKGWYLVQVTYGYYFVLDINPLGKFMVDAFGERTELTKEDIECVVAYQKIEPRKED